MNESRDLDYTTCRFCDSTVPIWEVDDNGECEFCREMDYVEREALISDEEVLRNDFRSAHTM